MAFDVTILGSGSAKPTRTRCPSAHAVFHGDRLFLVDCGEGTQMQMARCSIAIERVHSIFLTHLHADHALGIFGLIASLSMSSRTAPLTVYAHGSFEPVFRQTVAFFVNRMSFELAFVPIDSEANVVIYEDNGITVTTVPLRHRVPTCGFIFREKPFPPNLKPGVVEEHHLSLAQIARLKEGQDIVLEDGELLSAGECLYQKRRPVSYAYLSDTLFTRRAIPMVEGVDLLYHEATYMADLLPLAKQTGHSTTLQAAEFAKSAGAGKLIVGHYSARYTDLAPLLGEVRSVFQNAVLAIEGQSHRVAWR